jgi:hypothetical protein
VQGCLIAQARLTKGPGWEILLWLQSWIDSTNRTVQGFLFKPTAYAYYLATNTDGTFLGSNAKISITGLDTPSSAAIQKYQQSLQDMATYTGRPLYDWPTRFAEEKLEFNDAATLAQWVMSETHAAWGRLCRLGPEFLACKWIY